VLRSYQVSLRVVVLWRNGFIMGMVLVVTEQMNVQLNVAT